MFNRPALTLLVAATLALFSTASPHYRPVQISNANSNGPAVITTIPLTRRTSLKRADGVFDAEKARRSVITTKNKHRQNLINLERNLGREAFPKGAEIKPLATLEKRQSGSESLTDINQDTEWAGNVLVGTPGKNFLIDFDTGSSDLWIPSAACVTHETCDSKNKYDAKASSTSKPQAGEFRIRYGDNSTVKGDIVTDTVSVAGIKVTDQFLSAATNISALFASDPIDGLLGLAFPEISNLNHTPFFHNAIVQKTVSEPRFAFFLSNTSASELHIGGVNQSLFKGNIESHQVSNKSIGFWQIANGCVDVDQNKNVQNGFDTIIDSGTTIMYGTNAGVKAVYDKIKDARPVTEVDGLDGFYEFPCNTTPKVSFGFGRSQWQISEDNFNLGQTTNTSTFCVGALAAQDIGLGNTWLLGDSFMKNVYSVFDVGSRTVGFAQLSH